MERMLHIDVESMVLQMKSLSSFGGMIGEFDGGSKGDEISRRNADDMIRKWI